MIKFSKCVAVVVAVFAIALPGAAPAKADIVERIINAYGGLDALRKAGSMRQVGKIISTRRGADRPGTTERIFVMPDRLRVTIDYLGEPQEVRIIDAGRGYKNGRTAPEELRQAMILQVGRIAMPQILFSKGVNIDDMGTRTGPDGRAWHLLRVNLPSGLDLFAFVDPQSGLIKRTQGFINAGQNRMEFATDYSDYRWVEGLRVATREENFAMGQHIATTYLEKVEFLTAFPRNAFKP